MSNYSLTTISTPNIAFEVKKQREKKKVKRWINKNIFHQTILFGVSPYRTRWKWINGVVSNVDAASRGLFRDVNGTCHGCSRQCIGVESALYAELFLAIELAYSKVVLTFG